MIESIEYVYNMYTTATAQLLCLYIVLAFGVRRRSSAAPAARPFCKRMHIMHGSRDQWVGTHDFVSINNTIIYYI